MGAERKGGRKGAEERERERRREWVCFKELVHMIYYGLAIPKAAEQTSKLYQGRVMLQSSKSYQPIGQNPSSWAGRSLSSNLQLTV